MAACSALPDVLGTVWPDVSPIPVTEMFGYRTTALEVGGGG